MIHDRHVLVAKSRSEESKENLITIGCIYVNKNNEKQAKLGMLAVSFDYQGKGIGRDLCKTVEAYAFQRGFRSLTVATQLVNHSACKFYEKMGMNLVESVSIYHLWL